MKCSVWIVIPAGNNSCLIIALVAVSVIVTKGNVTIRECSQSHRGGPIPDDGQPVSFTCDGLPANEQMQWLITPNNGSRVSRTCDLPGKTCDTGNRDFQVSRDNATSVLKVVKNHQMWLDNSKVVCSAGGSNFDTCNVTYTFTATTVTTIGTTTTVHSTSSTTGERSSSTQDPELSTSSPDGPSQSSTSISSTTPETPTGGSTSISSTTPETPTGVQTSTDGEGNEEKGDGLPIAAIAGGAAAFLVIIIIIIIVVVVVVRRRKRQKKAHADNNVLEEHVNPMYSSGDEPETASPSNSKPSGVALRIPTDTSNNDNNAATLEDADNAFDAGYSSMVFGEQQTVSPSSTPSPGGQSSQNTANQEGFPTNTTTSVVVTDADLYTAVDGMDQEQTSGPVQDHAGGHSTEGGPKSFSTAASSGDVYAVVQKSGPRAQSATTTVSPSNPGDSADGAYAFVDVSRSSASTSSASKAPSVDPVSDNADNTYAVVNKSSSRGKGTGPSTSPDTSNSSQQAPSGDVYAQVDKSSKRNGSTRENDGEGQSYVYAQVDKGNNPTPVQQTQAQDQKPGIKPKPALKPKPSSNA